MPRCADEVPPMFAVSGAGRGSGASAASAASAVGTVGSVGSVGNGKGSGHAAACWLLAETKEAV
jgi:hypothetical protein